MPNKRKSSDDAALPDHLGTEVRWWTSFLTTRSPPRSPSDADAVDVAEFFAQDDLCRASLPVRQSCRNALSQYHREYVGGENPFDVQPYPYPLLMRFVPPFKEVWAHVAALPPVTRAYGVLLTVGRLRVEDCLEKPVVVDGGLRRDGHVVPLTTQAAEWLSAWRRPRSAKDVRTALGPYSVSEMHASVVAALQARGVPERTIMMVYGRQSAMKYCVADRPLGYFRTDLLAGDALRG